MQPAAGFAHAEQCSIGGGFICSSHSPSRIRAWRRRRRRRRCRLQRRRLQPLFCPARPPAALRLSPLQGNIKRDPAGYSDEFQLQWRHYKACLALFLLKPAQPGSEFGDLVNFVAQVSSAYPAFAPSFAPDIMDLLDKHHAVLEPALRQVRPGTCGRRCGLWGRAKRWHGC